MAHGGKGKGPGAWQTSTSYAVALRVVVEARKTAGLSQRDVTNLLKKPQSWLGKIETKERRMDVIEFIAIARALDLDEAQLLKVIATRLPRRLEV